MTPLFRLLPEERGLFPFIHGPVTMIPSKHSAIGHHRHWARVH